MSEFDPYLKWLGIRDPQRPVDHYTLLGIARFEDDKDVITSAADRQMLHVRSFQTGKHAMEAQTLLNELARARRCLMMDDRKAAYDQQLNAKLAAAQTAPPEQSDLLPPGSLAGPQEFQGQVEVVSSPAPQQQPAYSVTPAPSAQQPVYQQSVDSGPAINTGTPSSGAPNIRTGHKRKKSSKGLIGTIIGALGGGIAAVFVANMIVNSSWFKGEENKQQAANSNERVRTIDKEGLNQSNQTDQNDRSLDSNSSETRNSSGEPSNNGAQRNRNSETNPNSNANRQNDSAQRNSNNQQNDDSGTNTQNNDSTTGNKGEGDSDWDSAITENEKNLQDEREKTLGNEDNGVPVLPNNSGNLLDGNTNDSADNNLLSPTKKPIVRVPLPSDDEVSSAQDLLSERYKIEIESAFGFEDKIDLADIFLSRSKLAETDAERYALLTAANKIYCDVGKGDKAVEAMIAMEEAFELEDFWGDARKKMDVVWRNIEEDWQITDMYPGLVSLISRAINEKEYSIASYYSGKARSLANKEKNEIRKERFNKVHSFVQQLGRYELKSKNALTAIEAGETDKKHYLDHGDYLVFVAKQIDVGCKYWLESGNQERIELAQLETSELDVTGKFNLARRWFEFGEDYDNFGDHAALMRAKELFEEVLPDLDRLKGDLARLRLSKINSDTISFYDASVTTIEPLRRYRFRSQDSGEEVILNFRDMTTVEVTMRGNKRTCQCKNEGTGYAIEMPIFQLLLDTSQQPMTLELTPPTGRRPRLREQRQTIRYELVE